MLQYPTIDPVALKLGPVSIHWYGIMYLLGFVSAWWLARIRARRSDLGWTNAQISDLLFYGAMGVILGGRLGYVIFYMLFHQFDELAANPLKVFYIWEGGMSFHGGFLGVVVAVWLFCKHTGKSVFRVLDFVAPIVPIGLGLGRLGNFIGAELYGRVTDKPWGMVFPNAGPQPRHPSQLYQLGLEGILLFVIVWVYSSRPRPDFATSGLFCICYGAFRFFVEFFRQPDSHINFIAFQWLTMGQLLSVPMIIGGMLIMWLASSKDAFNTSKNKQGKGQVK